jgi:hypothetical protein
MFAVIFLVSALILGWTLVRWLGLPLFKFEVPALAAILGIFTWLWLSFLLSLMIPYRISLTATVIIAVISSIVLWKRPSPPLTILKLPPTRRDIWLWSTFTLITTIGLAWLFWTHDLISQPTGIYSAGSTWADYGLHASLISHFAVASRLPLDFPLAAGAHLTYPFLADLLSAWLVIGGWSLHLAIVIPNLILTLTFIQLFIGFAIRLTGRVSSAIAGLSLALLCGSTIGLSVAWHDWHSGHLSLWQFLNQLPQDYSSLDTQNAHLVNLVADIILPQHAFLLGLPIFAVVMVLMYEARRQHRTKWILTAGALVGLLPLAHPHTFVVLAIILATFTLENLTRCHTWRTPWRSRWVAALALTVALALPQYLWQSLANHLGTGGHWAPGWMVLPSQSLPAFWWNNFGPTGIWLIVLPALLWIRRSWRPYFIWYLPFAAIFIFANLYSLQPFSFDNVKLMMYVYLIGLLLAADLGLQTLRRRPWLTFAAIPIIILCISSGSLTIIREFQLHDQFASPDDQALARWVKADTPTGTVFATTDSPNQPIATLAGRPIVLGYEGWLYNFHLNYTSRVQAVSNALIGNPAGLSTYHARYLTVSVYDRTSWTVNLPALNAQFPIVYQNATWTVYRLPADK